jgi:hypothetical protein
LGQLRFVQVSPRDLICYDLFSAAAVLHSLVSLWRARKGAPMLTVLVPAAVAATAVSFSLVRLSIHTIPRIRFLFYDTPNSLIASP